MRAAASAQSIRRVSCDNLTSLDKQSEDESITSNETEDDKQGNNSHLPELDVKSLDFDGTHDCLSSVLVAHFTEKLLPEEPPSCTSLDPLPLDDPFNSYIDQLLGPIAGF